MTLPAALKRLIEEQEALEAKRTSIVLAIEDDANSATFKDEALLFLQMVLSTQMHVSKQLVAECANVTCEFVQWPHEIRA